MVSNTSERVEKRFSLRAPGANVAGIAPANCLNALVEDGAAGAAPESFAAILEFTALRK